MKKIRLLALLLALLMVLSVVLVACGGGDDGDDKDPDKDEEEKDPDDDDDDEDVVPVVQDDDGSRIGYLMYFHFNAAKTGRFAALSYSAAADKYMEYKRAPYSDYFSAPNKTGGMYTIEKKVGSDADNCLLIHRDAGVNSDPFVDILASSALGNLDTKHTLSFKVRLEDGLNGTSTAVRGRKTVSSAGQFIDFVRFDNASVYDCNGALVYGPDSAGYVQGWHTVHLFIDDADREYNIYVDGYKVNASPIKYNNDNYPDTQGAQVDAYRFTIDAIASRINETFFYLDDISVQNTENDTEFAKGENIVGDGMVHYEKLNTTFMGGLFNPSVEDMVARWEATGYNKFRQSIFSSNLSLASLGLAKKTASGEIVDLVSDYGVQQGYYDAISVFTNGNMEIKVWSEFVDAVYTGKVAFDPDKNTDDGDIYATYTAETKETGIGVVFTWDGAAPVISDKSIASAMYNEATGALVLYAANNYTDEVATFKLNKSVEGVYTSADDAYSVEFVDETTVTVALGDVNGDFLYVINDDGSVTVKVDPDDESKDITLGYKVGKNTLVYNDVEILPEATAIDATLAAGEKLLMRFGDFATLGTSLKFEDADFNAAYRDPSVYGEYDQVMVTFYASAEMVSAGYQFIFYVGCGNNEGGISYYQTVFNPTSGSYRYKEGWNTYIIDIKSLGMSRSPDLSRFSHLSFEMGGWSNGPAKDGKAADGYYVYFEQFTLISSMTETFANPAEGMEDCKHLNMQPKFIGVVEGETTYSCGHAYCAHGEYYINKCTDCGYEEAVKDTMVPSGALHSFSDVLKIKYASCGQEGYSYYECTGCGYENIIDTYPALNHTYYEESTVIDNYIIKDLLCTICGSKTQVKGYSEHLSFQQKVEANGFVPGQYISTENYPTAKYGTYTTSGQANGAGAFFEITHKYAVLEAKASKSGVLGFEYSRTPDSNSSTFFSDAYVDLNTATSESNILVPMGTRFVFEIDLMLGNKGADGKYPQINSSIMDRGYGGSGKVGTSMFSMTPDGNFTFGTYTFALSETEFNNFAFYIKPDENAMDLYVNGVLVATKTIAASVDVAMTMCACDWRVTYVAGKTNEQGASFWFNNMMYYITDFGPASVVVDKGDLDNANREVELESSNFDKITYPLTVNGEDVIGYVPADYKSDKYVFEATFNGSDLADGVLLEGWKRFSGYDYYEDLLTVKDGKIYSCGVLISETTENVKIALLFDDSTKTVKIYVNGTVIPGGSFGYANNYYAQSNAIKGFIFRSSVGEYTVTDVRVYSGSALKPVATPAQ